MFWSHLFLQVKPTGNSVGFSFLTGKCARMVYGVIVGA